MANSEGKIGFFAALWRWVSFYEARKALGLVRAADKQFTGSAAGIADAFDLHHEQLKAEFGTFWDSLSAVENAVEMKRIKLEAKQKLVKDKQNLLNGALAECDKAEARNDAAALAEAEAAGAEYSAELKKVQAEVAALETDLKDQEARLLGLEDQLNDMKKRISELPAEKAEAIADFVSNSAIIDAFERINGLKSRLDRGPIDAVLDANKELAAKARVAGRMSNAANTDKDAKYRAAAETSDANSDFAKLRAARKAEREAASGTTPNKTDERPNII